MLDTANETVAGRDEAISSLEESLSESSATLKAKGEWISGSSEELARTAQQHAAGLSGARSVLSAIEKALGDRHD